MTDGRTLLGDKHLQMVCVLRINRAYMEYMRTQHPELALKLSNIRTMKMKEFAKKAVAAAAAAAATE